MPTKTATKPPVIIVGPPPERPPDVRAQFIAEVEAILDRRFSISLDERFLAHLPPSIQPHDILNVLPMRSDGEYKDEIAAILAAYDGLTARQRRDVSFDALAAKAGITSHRFAGILSDTLMLFGKEEVADLKHAIRPLLIRESLRQAFGDSRGARAERRDWLQALGDLPASKNTIFQVSATATAVVAASDSLPSFEGQMLAAQQAIDVEASEPDDDEDDDEDEGDD